MSYIADCKCPKCGNSQQLHLGNFGFHPEDKIHCKYCWYNYDAQKNCTNMVVDKTIPPESKDDKIEKLKHEIYRLMTENKKLRKQIKKGGE